MFPRATGGSSTDRLAIEQQVERLAASSVLQHSEALCQLLRYLVAQRLDRPHEHVKEYQIALDVLGRPDSFDPHTDSAVRVQTSRLRNKLVDYYAGAGTDDAVLIEIPKGSYSPVFHERTSAPPPVAQVAAGPSRRRSLAFAGSLALLIITALLLTAILSRTKAASLRARDPLAVFWQGFLDSDVEPLVVFSNAEFIGRPETGLRYFTPGRDAADAVFDHYTGVGEVLSVHELDQVFSRLNKRLQVKRGRLLNWDDAKGRDLIFLGSPSENLSLQEVPLGREFRFQTMQGPPRPGDLGIVNLHPAPAEQPVYFGTKQLPIVEDYALVELVKGSTPARSVLMLAGTTTFGTEAAAEFACNPDRIRELLPHISNASGGLAEFAALLHVKVNRGVPIETTLVALRKH